MATFWIFIALVLLVSLLLIWLPHFRQQKLIRAEEAGVRNQTNMELFNERLAVLEKELQEGLLDQTEFDSLKQELEISLLQDMKQGEDESLSHKAKPKGILWPAIMSVAVIAIAGFAYLQLGAYKELPLLDSPQGANPHAGMSPEQLLDQEIAMLKGQVDMQPDNSQAWFNLGHAYISANRYDDAVKAFDKVIALVGPHAELLGPKATAIYYKNNQTMTPEVQALVDEALKLDPKDPSTQLLIGMNAFYTADYQAAINAWQTILSNESNDYDRSAIINAINTAKMRMSAENGEAAMPHDANHEGVIANDKKVTINVSISPELKEKVGPTDMLFVFARSTDGDKVPLAATKISAKALPAKVVLDNTTSMGGSQKLSDAKNVEIIAVLSKHGSVRPQPGDLQGILPLVPVGDTATLVLDSVVQ